MEAVRRGRATPVEGRELGRVVGGAPGPTFLCVAGIHGNEPAGVHAVRRILPRLAERAHMLAGEFVALAGNVSALAEGRRFIDRDLNRAWSPARLSELREGGAAEVTCVEDREQLDLMAGIESAAARARGPVYALDLHTTSGPGGIFSAFTDSLPHRAFAQAFPVPMIFGLEELVDGTLLNLLSEEGFVALTVETGQHDEPEAVDRAEAAIWIGLVAAGVLPETATPEAGPARRELYKATAHLPRALEMRYRRAVEVGDGFVMEPGYSNFQDVEVGEVIARDANGPIAVGEPSKLLMPLYQVQGEDGYFLVREFSRVWMHVSYVLRRAGVSRLAHLLPGVRRVEGTSDEVVVDQRVAKLFARELFHLLGFRQMEEAGSRLIMRRRPFDESRRIRSAPEMERRSGTGDRSGAEAPETEPEA